MSDLFSFYLGYIKALLNFCLSNINPLFSFCLNYIYVPFLLLLTGVVLLLRVPRVAEINQSVIHRLSAFLSRRGAFQSNPTQEPTKFAIIRIIFGALLIQTSFFVLYYLAPSEWSNPVIVILASLSFLFSICVFLGLLTPLSLGYLIIVQWQIGDRLLLTGTLSNYIATMLSIMLILSKSGAHLSIDGMLFSKGYKLSNFVRHLYGKTTVVNFTTLQIAKFIAISSYSIICIYSVLVHLNQASWLTGSAAVQLLSSNYLSSKYQFFTHLFENSEWMVLLSRASLWLMLPWYFLVGPAVIYGKLPRKYAITWGFCFILFSKFVLQLGWLADYEILLWLGLFWQTFAIDSTKYGIAVAYDDRCNLCHKTIRIIKLVDIFNLVQLKPISKNISWLQTHRINKEDGLRDLHGLSNEKLYIGYDLYLTLTRRLLLLLPFFPILLLGKYLKVGPSIYRRIADHRLSLFGECSIPIKTPPSSETVASQSDVSDGKNKKLLVNYLFPQFVVLFLFYCSALPFPYIGQKTVPGLSGVGNTYIFYQRGIYPALVLGMTPLNVFNREDLGATENWFTLEAIDNNNNRTYLPVFAPDGARLAMHRSERFYHGLSLFFRRTMLGKPDTCGFDAFSKEIITVSSCFNKPDTQKFVYKQYHQLLPKVADIVQNKFTVAPVKQVCQHEYIV